MKKFFCGILVLVMLLTCSVPIYASEPNDFNENESISIVFDDLEGKENEAVVSINDEGVVEVRYYIAGQLDNIVCVTTESDSSVSYVMYNADSEVIEEDVVYIENGNQNVAYEMTPSAYSLNGYTYSGTIEYYPHQVGYAAGLWHRHSVEIYQRYFKTTYDYKTMNFAAGTVVSIAIGALAAVICAAFPIATDKVTEMFYAATVSSGTAIISGAIQTAMTKTYYVMDEWYDMKAVDASSGNSKTISGEIYYLALEDGTYSSEPTYDRYMAWDSGNYPTLIFESFWDCTFPGVKNIMR